MSSARNHAKRSHRSEARKRSAVGMSARRMWITSEQKAVRKSIFQRLRNLFHFDTSSKESY